jgi:hypothetical protein
MMKKVLGIMALFAVVLIFGGGFISMIMSRISGGGVDESYISPIYGGIILLSGLVGGCTCVLYEKLNDIEKRICIESKNKEPEI